MFGLEKKRKAPFQFDLEKDLKKDKKMRDELLKTIEHRSNELKAMLRDGSASEDFDKCGILLHGYAALTKVIDRVVK